MNLYKKSQNVPTEQNKNFYITTTLPYVNAKPHVGHIMEFIRADAIARHRRMDFQFQENQKIDSTYHEKVFFNTGSDEHGLKIYQKAVEQNLSPQEFVDEQHLNIKSLKEKANISYDRFIRTTDEDHKKAAQKFWQICEEKGFIYKKNYTGLYCVGCEAFLSEKDLINGECQDHPGKKLENISEENYFFKYSEFENQLLDLYNHKNQNGQSFVVPETRLNEAKKLVENKLEDFSISRLKERMPWGIEVPGDNNHVMYVWFDALVNYISTLGWPDSDPESNFDKFWNRGQVVQICGKDNLQFQATRWQAMLMSVGIKNSDNIIVNGFITSGGQKMSKTVGNVVDPIEYIDKYGIDAVRYFVTRELHPFEDSDFSEEKFKESYNANLANGLGNVVSRVIQMAIMNNLRIEKSDLDYNIRSNWSQHQEYHKSFNEFNLQKASDYVWNQIKEVDSIIAETEPFKLIKNNKEQAEEIIKNLLIKVWQIAFLVEPILPQTADTIKKSISDFEKPKPLFVRI